MLNEDMSSRRYMNEKMKKTGSSLPNICEYIHSPHNIQVGPHATRSQIWETKLINVMAFLY